MPIVSCSVKNGTMQIVECKKEMRKIMDFLQGKGYITLAKYERFIQRFKALNKNNKRL